MNVVDVEIMQAVRQVGHGHDVRSSSPLGGGHKHTVRAVTLANGQVLVAKVGVGDARAMLIEEHAGLVEIQHTRTVRTPGIVGLSDTSNALVLLTQWVEPRHVDDNGWRKFGAQLAAMHASHSGTQYGFAHDNHIGATPQPNTWCDDWVIFNQQHRLGSQLRRAVDAKLIEASQVVRVQGLIDRLGRYLPSDPPPALLHGDLWSGNVIAGDDGFITVIDPACSIGDGWADIAMMMLFGGIPNVCIDAYRASTNDHDDIASRIAVYQLYHMLNHVNLFGRSYLARVMRLLDQLGV